MSTPPMDDFDAPETPHERLVTAALIMGMKERPFGGTLDERSLPTVIDPDAIYFGGPYDRGWYRYHADNLPSVTFKSHTWFQGMPDRVTGKFLKQFAVDPKNWNPLP